MSTPTPRPLPGRTRWAARGGVAAARLSRALGRGDGTVIGGRVSLAVDPDVLRRLAAGRWIALVSGTNGKTTTTRLLTAALGTAGPVVTNPQGSNLPPGIVAGLAAAPPGGRAAIEVDEGWLGHVASAVEPAVIALLNLSRDQLDRVAEVRRIAQRWRAVLADHPATRVVANADDPLVAWAASAAPDRVTWVAAGQPWLDDAVGCPACGGHLVFAADASWACGDCGFARPDPEYWLEGGPDAPSLCHGAERLALVLALPGRANRANALTATAVAALAGVSPAVALGAMSPVDDVDGRYRTVHVGGRAARLLLAKNPAGWLEVFGMLAPAPAPVVVVINSRIADGRDPSWLWDVPFEQLAGRDVVAAGDRSRDLAVRLRYAGVEHARVDDPLEAIGSLPAGAVDVAANYTALRDIVRRLRGVEIAP